MKAPVSCEDSPIKLHMEKVVTDTEVLGQTFSPRKNCAKFEAKSPKAPGVAGLNLQISSPSKRPHNKENITRKALFTDVASDDEVILSSGGLAEDSGYLSLQNSQLDHGDVDFDSAETLEKSSKERESLSSNLDVHSCSGSAHLPLLKFQQEVCRELAKSYKRTQSYDWTVVNKLASNYGLYNVIGGKMGLECVDILGGLLKKDMKHILTRILRLLGECDLINCKKVSKTWRKIICQDKVALKKCRETEQNLQDNVRSAGGLSRDFALDRVVFSCIQTVASTPVHKPNKKTPTDCTQGSSQPSRFQQYQKAAQSLKQHEALKSCRRCGSPSRYDAAMRRAVCTRQSCGFDFCTRCLAAFHGSAPCHAGAARGSRGNNGAAPVAGSARSKRNVRRL